MKNLGKWMLGAAIVAGGLGLGTAKAEAAEFRVVFGGQADIPPCPGPGYVWINGYYDGGYWIPGRWNYQGVAYGYDRNDYYYGHVDRDHYRRYDNDRRFYGDRDRDRRFYGDRDDHRRYDRDDHRDHDGDRFRH